MDAYVASLLLFIIFLVTATYSQQRRHLSSRFSLVKPTGGDELEAFDDELHDVESDSPVNRYYHSLSWFLLIHGLSVAADMLQVNQHPT